MATPMAGGQTPATLRLAGIESARAPSLERRSVVTTDVTTAERSTSRPARRPSSSDAPGAEAPADAPGSGPSGASDAPGSGPSAEFYERAGDLAKAEHLHEQSLNADPPVDLVTADQMYGQTPLFEAARSGHLTMARWLVAHGAQANKVNEWGDSAASEAASMGHWDIVWFLADSGADLTRKVEHAHSTLVLSAVRHKSLEALKAANVSKKLEANGDQIV